MREGKRRREEMKRFGKRDGIKMSRMKTRERERIVAWWSFGSNEESFVRSTHQFFTRLAVSSFLHFSFVHFSFLHFSIPTFFFLTFFHSFFREEEIGIWYRQSLWLVSWREMFVYKKARIEIPDFICFHSFPCLWNNVSQNLARKITISFSLSLSLSLFLSSTQRNSFLSLSLSERKSSLLFLPSPY